MLLVNNINVYGVQKLLSSGKQVNICVRVINLLKGGGRKSKGGREDGGGGRGMEEWMSERERWEGRRGRKRIGEGRGSISTHWMGVIDFVQ